MAGRRWRAADVLEELLVRIGAVESSYCRPAPSSAGSMASHFPRRGRAISVGGGSYQFSSRSSDDWRNDATHPAERTNYKQTTI